MAELAAHRIRIAEIAVTRHTLEDAGLPADTAEHIAKAFRPDQIMRGLRELAVTEQSIYALLPVLGRAVPLSGRMKIATAVDRMHRHRR